MAVGAADYSKVTEGLSLSQAKLLLSLQGLDAEQQTSLLLQAGLISSSEQMQAKHIARALTESTLENTEKNRILTQLGLLDAETGEILTSQTCTQEKLLQALATTTLDEEEKQEILTKVLGTVENGKYAVSFDVLTGAIWNNIKAMAKWLITNPIGQIGLIIASLGLLTKGFNSVIESKEKLADKKLEGIDKEISELDAEITSLESLQSKLDNAKGNKIELAQIQNELNDAIGDTPGLLNGEGKAYDVANAKLKAYIESKKQERDASKKNKINASKEKFDNSAYEADGWFSIDATAEQMRQWAKMYQGFVNYYNKLPSDSKEKASFADADEYAQSAFRMFAGKMDMEGWSDYWDEQVSIAYDAFADVIEDYEGYGGQDFLKGLIANMVRGGSDFSEISGVVQNILDNSDMQNAINTYWESLVDPDIDSEEALSNVKKIFDNLISQYPQLESFFDGVYERIVSGGNKVADATSDSVKGVTSLLKDVTTTLSDLQDKYDEVTSAQEEYNSTGAISADTMQKLIDNDLLGYLDFSSGKLKVNTDALLAQGEAAKVAAIQSLQKAMAEDLAAIAAGDDEKASNLAKTAIANLGNAAEKAGGKAQTAAGLLAGFAVAAQAAKDGAEGNLADGVDVDTYRAKADAVIAAYTSAANQIGKITIKSPKTSKSSGSGGSSSSSDKNEELENYLKYCEELYKVHQDELKYIHDIQWGYDNLAKTEEERKDILDKIEQARKDYADNQVKDLEHQIALAENLNSEYADTLEYYNRIQEIAHAEADRLRSIGYDDNSDEVQEWQNKCENSS